MQAAFKKHKEIYLSLALCAVLLAILGGVLAFVKFKGPQQEAPEEEAPAAIVAAPINPFDTVSLEARAAYVKNIETGEVLYSKNAGDILPLASLTKLMTTLAAYELLGQGGATITIRYEDLEPDGDWALIPGETFNLKKLIDFTLISSSNDTAAALAFAAERKLAPDTTLYTKKNFISHMNILAGKLGMERTRFSNETGLDIAGASGASGSAKDISILVEHILKNYPELLYVTRDGSFVLESQQGITHAVGNTNPIVGELPNLIGSKTGYTDLAGGNLTVVIDPALNSPIVITVLGSSKEGRFADVEKLAAATMAHFAQDSAEDFAQARE